MISLFLMGAMGLVVLVWAFMPMGFWRALTLAVILVGGSCALYGWRGMAGMPDLPADLLNSQHPERQRLLTHQKRLIAFLEKNPESCEGWFLLEKSCEVLDKKQESLAIKQHTQHFCPRLMESKG